MITGLIGPNGAGKTTLFNLITGFLKPDDGFVYFKGENITHFSPHEVFHKGLCRTFQIPKEHKQMTVLENLMLIPPRQIGEKIWGPWFRPTTVRQQEGIVRDKALEVLEFIDLLHLRDELAANLSGGQKKLLELGRTLMADPELVLLDEPAAGINRTLMHKLTENIECLCYERGITFLVIEHDMDLIMSMCSPVIVMSEGKKLAEGTPHEIQHHQAVLEAYLGGQYAVTES